MKHEISVIVPFYNEKPSLPRLYHELKEANKGRYAEYIFIDDGSDDGGNTEISKLMEQDDNVRLFSFRRNMGKSAALDIGFQNADGDIVITIDADLQDIPEEIPRLIEKLNEGYDIVSGWKQDRKDSGFKVLASRIFNLLIRTVSGVKLHDFNCGFKAYKSEVVKTVRIYGEMHRFIPVLASEYGFKSVEIPVKHRKREFGSSKYGPRRYLRGLFDFISVSLMLYYFRSPLRLIGIPALIFSVLGALLIAYSAVMKFAYGETGVRPALLAGIFFMTAAIQIVMTGFVAELITFYFHKNGRHDSAYLKKNRK